METRGYSKNSLKRAFHKAASRPREETLYKKDKSPSGSINRFITQYGSHNKQFLKIPKHWRALKNDEKISSFHE